MMRVLLCCAAVFLAACASPVEPELSAVLDWGDFVLPEPDPSLDPHRLAVGELLATPCAFTPYGNQLEHLRDRHEWIVVDVVFGRTSADGPWDGPTPEDKAWITSRGGRVLYDFSIPMTRARIVASEIPALVRDMVQAGQWPLLWDVPDLSRYDIPRLSVGFAVRLTDEHVRYFESLGGRVEHRLDFIDALSGPLPDRSVPSLRDRGDVAYLEPPGVLCLT